MSILHVNLLKPQIQATHEHTAHITHYRVESCARARGKMPTKPLLPLKSGSQHSPPLRGDGNLLKICVEIRLLELVQCHEGRL